MVAVEPKIDDKVKYRDIYGFVHVDFVKKIRYEDGEVIVQMKKAECLLRDVVTIMVKKVMDK